MRVKLTAKHPRPTSSTRSPIRSGSITGRKPARDAAPEKALVKRGKPADARAGSTGRSDASGERRPFKSRDAAGDRDTRSDQRRPFKPRGDDSRAAFGDRGPRRTAEGHGDRHFRSDERRPFKPGGDDARPAFGDRGPRRPAEARGNSDSRSDERRPFKPRGDDSRAVGDRGPRRATEGHGDRDSRSDERRAFKPRGDDSRAAFGDRGPRRAAEGRGERHPLSDERRPFKPRGDDARPAFGDRGPRRAAEARGDRDSRSDERRAFKPRGDDSRAAFGDRGPRRPTEGRGDRDSRSDDRRPFKQRSDDSRPTFGDRGPRRPTEARGDRDSRSDDSRPSFSDRGPRKPTEARDSRTDDRRPSKTRGDAARPAFAANEGALKKPHAHGDNLVRLSKVMSELGLCSRREADEWIEKGWVLVDGEVIDTLGSRIRPDQNIEILPAARSAQSQLVTILLHKPVGYVSGQAEDGYEPAVTLINPSNHWDEDRSGIRFSPGHLRTLAPAGRLDIDSTGLLVLTQDGRIAKQLIGGHSEVDKEYLVRVRYGEHTVDVDQHLPAEKLALLRHGLELDGVPLKTAQVSWQNGEQLRFVLREGKKRQIRRMCELVGLEVVGLKRIRMGRVTLGALPPGQWRYLAPDETF
nr:pseudouridine synthase [Caballeronia sp. GAWG1-5s-s]